MIYGWVRIELRVQISLLLIKIKLVLCRLQYLLPYTVIVTENYNGCYQCSKIRIFIWSIVLYMAVILLKLSFMLNSIICIGF